MRQSQTAWPLSGLFQNARDTLRWPVLPVWLVEPTPPRPVWQVSRKWYSIFFFKSSATYSYLQRMLEGSRQILQLRHKLLCSCGHTHAKTHVCTHTQIRHTHKHTHAHTRARTHADARTRTHAHTRTHARARAHTHWHTHARAPARARTNETRARWQMRWGSFVISWKTESKKQNMDYQICCVHMIVCILCTHVAHKSMFL